MVTVASIIFLLGFVALGARPYRVAERLPPVEAVPPMPERYHPSVSPGTRAKLEALEAERLMLAENYATRQKVDAYIDRVDYALGGAPICFACNNTLTKPYPDRDYYCDHCQGFVSLQGVC